MSTNEKFSFSIENHSIGNNDDKCVGKIVHKLT